MTKITYVEDIADITGFKDRGFFFDTNVWYYIYGPTSVHSPQAKKFSNFYSKLLKSRRPIYTDAIVVSEFANLFLRKNYEAYCIENGLVGRPTFKVYKTTQHAREAVSDLSDNLSFILGDSIVIDACLAGVHFDNLCGKMKTTTADLNDFLFEHACSIWDFVFVTNDVACLSFDLDIITLRQH